MTLANTVCSRAFSQQLKLEVNLQYAEAHPGLFVFKLTRAPVGVVLPQFKSMVAESAQEGVATKEALEAYAQGAAQNIETLPLFWVSDLYLETARQQGFSAASQVNPDKRVYTKELRQDVYTALVTQNLTADNLIRVDTGAHMLFSWDNNNLPIALHFDYIDGQMSDAYYHLDALVEHLQKDKRVTLFRDKLGQLVHGVPHYNAGSCSCFVSFVFSPTKEEAIQLWDKMRSYGTKYPSTQARQAVLDLDLLKLHGTGIPRDTAELAEQDE